MRALFRNRVLLLLDLIGWSVIPMLALAVRLDGWDGAGPYLLRLALFTAWAILWQFGALYASGMYRGVWRYASVDEFSGVVGSLAVAGVLAASCHLLLGSVLPLGEGMQRLPRSLPILNMVLAVAWSSGARFILRYGAHLAQRRAGRLGRRRAVLVGETPAMAGLIRSLHGDRSAPYDPVAVVRIAPERTEVRYLEDVRVLGDLRELLVVLRAHHALSVIFSLADLGPDQILLVANLVAQVEGDVQVLPSGERAEWGALRALGVDDLGESAVVARILKAPSAARRRRGSESVVRAAH